MKRHGFLQPVTGLVLIVFLLIGCGRTRIDTAHHPNGNLMYEITYRGDTKHGPTVFYYHDGRKEAEYNYHNDALHGRTARWYFNGNMEYEEFYRDNQLHGLSRRYFNTGALSIETHYRNGELHGEHTEYWENGTVKVQGAHYHGMFDGTWKYYDQQGLKVGEATFDKGTGVMTAYHPNGNKHKEIHYLDNVKHGTETTWDLFGTKIKQVEYNLGNPLIERNFQ